MRADGGKVGVFYNKHAYTVKTVSDDGTKVILEDTANGGTITKKISELPEAFLMRNKAGGYYETGEYIVPTTPSEDPVTTPYEFDITTPYEGN